MLRKCQHCGTVIEDNDKVFCPNCSELIDRDLNLIRNLDKTMDNYKEVAKERHEEIKKTINTQRRDYDDDIEIKKYQQEKTNPLIIAVIIILFILTFIIFYLAIK